MERKTERESRFFNIHAVCTEMRLVHSSFTYLGRFVQASRGLESEICLDFVKFTLTGLVLHPRLDLDVLTMVFIQRQNSASGN